MAHIVKAAKTGHSLSLSIPKSVREEIGVDITTYFYVTAVDKDTLMFRKVAAGPSIADKKISSRKVKHAKRRARSSKH